MLIFLSLLLICVNNVFLFRDVYIYVFAYTPTCIIDPYVCMCHRLLVSVYIVCSTIVRHHISRFWAAGGMYLLNSDENMLKAKTSYVGTSGKVEKEWPLKETVTRGCKGS